MKRATAFLTNHQRGARCRSHRFSEPANSALRITSMASRQSAISSCLAWDSRMKRRVAIIGTGWVGASVAISTLHSGIADEILLNDDSYFLLSVRTPLVSQDVSRANELVSAGSSLAVTLSPQHLAAHSFGCACGHGIRLALSPACDQIWCPLTC
jgi:hypothetical protein